MQQQVQAVLQQAELCLRVVVIERSEQLASFVLPGTAVAPKVVTPEPEALRPSPNRQRVLDLPPSSPLAEIELGMSHEDVRRILGAPDDRIDRITAKAWIPFYTGPGAHLRDWIYENEGRIVFSLDDGSLEVLDVVYNPNEGK